MGRLSGSLVYLAGPIEYVKDYGAGWRDWITPKLKEMKIGVMDPLKKPMHTQFHEDIELQKVKKSLIEKKDYINFSKIMKEVVRADLRMVDKSDFLIVFIDMDAHICGTYHEMVMCAINRHPVLVVCRQGKHKLSPWLFGVFDESTFFDTFEELLQYLHFVNDSTHDIKGWHFFDYSRIY